MNSINRPASVLGNRHICMSGTSGVNCYLNSAYNLQLTLKKINKNWLKYVNNYFHAFYVLLSGRMFQDPNKKTSSSTAYKRPWGVGGRWKCIF